MEGDSGEDAGDEESLSLIRDHLSGHEQKAGRNMERQETILMRFHIEMKNKALETGGKAIPVLASFFLLVLG